MVNGKPWFRFFDSGKNANWTRFFTIFPQFLVIFWWLYKACVICSTKPFKNYQKKFWGMKKLTVFDVFFKGSHCFHLASFWIIIKDNHQKMAKNRVKMESDLVQFVCIFTRTENPSIITLLQTVLNQFWIWDYFLTVKTYNLFNQIFLHLKMKAKDMKRVIKFSSLHSALKIEK